MIGEHEEIQVVSSALAQVLRMNYQPEAFGSASLEISLYTHADFANPMPAGVSLFLYDMKRNRRPPIADWNMTPEGPFYQSPLPYDLYYLMTVWARDVPLQQNIAAWVNECLGRTLLLPSLLLETIAPGLFRRDTALEIIQIGSGADGFRRPPEIPEAVRFHLSYRYVVGDVRLSRLKGLGRK